MVYLTPRKDLLLLEGYNIAMHKMFGEVAKFQNDLCKGSYKDVLQPGLLAALESERLNLVYRKSWVNEAAHRYAFVPPWDEPLDRLEEIANRLDTNDLLNRVLFIEQFCNTSDPLCVRAYNGNMNYLLGAIKHTKERDAHKLLNPLSYPAFVLRWLISPFLMLFGSGVSDWTDKVLEGFAKQIGVLLAIALCAIIPTLRHLLYALVRKIFAYFY